MCDGGSGCASGGCSRLKGKFLIGNSRKVERTNRSNKEEGVSEKVGLDHQLTTAARRGLEKARVGRKEVRQANLGGDRAPGIEPDTALKRGVQLHHRP
jgi:hypothetical protein